MMNPHIMIGSIIPCGWNEYERGTRPDARKNMTQDRLISKGGGGVSIGSIMTHGYTMRYYEIYTSTIAYRNFYFFLMQLETNGSDFFKSMFFSTIPQF